jgi:hypothetical protein
MCDLVHFDCDFAFLCYDVLCLHLHFVLTYDSPLHIHFLTYTSLLETFICYIVVFCFTDRPRDHHDPLRPTATYRDPPRPTATHRDPLRPTATYRDLPRPTNFMIGVIPFTSIFISITRFTTTILTFWHRVLACARNSLNHTLLLLSRNRTSLSPLIVCWLRTVSISVGRRWWAPWLSVRVFSHFRTVSRQSRDRVTCHRHHTTYPDLYQSFPIVCDDFRSFLVICDDFYLRATSRAHCNSRISTMRHCGSYTVR